MPDTTVRYYDSTMSGAPALSGTAGTLIGILDACLVTGFGSVTLTSLVVASNVATATVSGGHGFAMVGNTGPVIRIEGATPAGLNGDWRVTVTSATQFTFATSGISDQTASGTITAKRAPAGFSKAYSGTNKAVYQRSAPCATAMMLRVADSTTTYATVNAYESMSDVDTGVDMFGGTGYFRKSDDDNATARVWVLFADAHAFYFFPYWKNGFGTEGCFFGDIVSYKNTIDLYHAGIIASVVSSSSYPGGNDSGQNDFKRLNSGYGHYLARSYDQETKNIVFYKKSHNLSGSVIGVGGVNYPDPMNRGLITAPIEVLENSNIRGVMPGLLNPIHNLPGTDKLIVAGGLPGRDVMLIKLNYGYGTDYGRCALDLTGPWR